MNNDLNTPALQWLATHSLQDLIQAINESQPNTDNKIVSSTEAKRLTKMSVYKLKKRAKPINSGKGNELEWYLNDLKPYIKAA